MLAALQDGESAMQTARNAGKTVPGEASHGGSARIDPRNAASRRPAETGPLGPESHPFADLARLRALLDPRSGGVAGAAVADRGAVTPATLAIEAERLDLAITLRQVRIGSIEAADLPAVVMLRDGSSRLVLARPEASTFDLATEDGLLRVPLAALEAAASGTIFAVRARPLPDMADEASSVPRGIWGFALPLLAEQRGRLAHVAMATGVINLFGLFFPLFSMAMFDRVVPHGAVETLTALASGVLLALGLEMLIRQARLKLHDAVAQSLAGAMQARVISRLLLAGAEGLPRRSGPVLQPLQDLEAFAHSLPHLVTAFAVDVPYALALFALLYFIGGGIVLVPLAALVLLIGLHVACHHLGIRAHAVAIGQLRRQAQQVIDMVDLAERIRATGAGKHLLANWDRTTDEAGFAAHRNRYWQGIASQGGVVLIQLAVAGTAIVGALAVIAGDMTIGGLSAAILLINRLLMPLSLATGTLLRSRQLAQTAAALLPLINQPIEHGGDRARTDLAAVPLRIGFHGVGFTHAEEARSCLAELSFTIEPGEKIGIIGRSGSGKSTLLRLIAGLCAPDAGRITIDGRDIAQVDPAAFRRSLGFMTQDTALFDTTLEENMTIGLDPVDRAEFDRVARLSGVHDFAQRHPRGYSMAVGPGGARLSGGERQAVSLARALMGAPRLLLLDEPTAAMDNSLEARIIAALGEHLGATGLVIASHRMPVLKLVDRIIWLEGGRIVADGPRDQVLARLGAAA